MEVSMQVSVVLDADRYDVVDDDGVIHEVPFNTWFMNKFYPSPVPVEVPVGFQHPPTIQEQIQMLFRSERLRQAAHDAGFETPEEADDFDVGDYEPTSPYEYNFDPSIKPPSGAFKEEKPSDVKQPVADVPAGAGAPPKAGAAPAAPATSDSTLT